MLTKRGFLAGAATLMLPSVAAKAQSWPSQPLRVLIGTAPGGAPDVVGRLVGEKLAAMLGQPVVIENAAGGGGVVSSSTASRARPDGTTFAIMTGGHGPQAAVRKSLPYDPVEGFSFVGTLCAYPMVLGVKPDSPIESFPDLLKRARTAEGKISYTITFPGSTHHLLGLWLNNLAGTKMLAIPYRGAGPGFADVLAGRVDVMLEPTTSAMPRVKSGQMRLLAVSSPQRFSLLPDTPTIAETLPGIEAMTWLGLITAPDTPASIVNRLNGDIRKALNMDDVKKKLFDVGTVPMPSSPTEFRDRVVREIARWKKIVKENGIEPI